MPTLKKIQISRDCVVCGVSFIPQRCIARCCSIDCRVKYSNIKRSPIKKEWASRNRDAISVSQKKWLLNNPERRKETSKNYIKRNPEYYRQYSTLYTRRLLQAKPKWADDCRLREIYKKAKELGLEVDHVIPLKNPLVCGLHVPENLQLLSRSENAKKSNKFNEDILVGYMNA